jgi:hypothetical protein
MGTAGLARCFVRGYRRVPAPPPRMTAATLLAFTFSPCGASQQVVSTRAAPQRRGAGRGSRGGDAARAHRSGCLRRRSGSLRGGGAAGRTAGALRTAAAAAGAEGARQRAARLARSWASKAGWVRAGPAAGPQAPGAVSRPVRRAAVVAAAARAARARRRGLLGGALTEQGAVRQPDHWRRRRPRDAGARSAPTRRPQASWRRARHRQRCSGDACVSGNEHKRAPRFRHTRASTHPQRDTAGRAESSIRTGGRGGGASRAVRRSARDAIGRSRRFAKSTPPSTPVVSPRCRRCDCCLPRRPPPDAGPAHVGLRGRAWRDARLRRRTGAASASQRVRTCRR